MHQMRFLEIFNNKKLISTLLSKKIEKAFFKMELLEVPLSKFSEDELKVLSLLKAKGSPMMMMN